MSLSNRYAVTVRFNQNGQQDLRALAEFWNMDQRSVVKFAVEQLIVSTKQLQAILAKQQEEQDVKATESADSSQPDTADGAGSGEQAVAPVADSAVADAAPAT